MIYIVTHKDFTMPAAKSEYAIIQVGAEGKKDLGFLKDNIGDNISDKNPYFCELTGLYWIWKNRKDDYKGIVHYRRFFNCSFRYEDIITEGQVKRILNKYDIILPFKKKLRVSVMDQYCEKSGFKQDLYAVREIIKKIFPEYLESYDEVLYGNEICFFNMMIANKNIFDAYCKWLFSILLELEDGKNLDSYNDYQKRIYGFLSERLLNVYVKHNKLRIFQCGVVSNMKWGIKKRVLTGCKRKLWYYRQIINKK